MMLDGHRTGHGRTDRPWSCWQALSVGDVIDAWRANEEGPCARCGARTHIYGPGGHPLCADCRPPETRAAVIPVPAGLTGQEYQRNPAPARGAA